MYVSTKVPIIMAIPKITENIVCRNNSIFIFSRLLSFIIDLYNRIPLTDIASKHGIYIRFCNSIEHIENIAPFKFPKVITTAEMV